VVSSAEDSINNQLRQQKEEDSGDIGRVSHIMASKIGVSHSTYERGKVIILKGTDEQNQKLRKGDTSITKEYNRIKQKEKQDQLIKEATEAATSNLRGEKESKVKLIQNDFQRIDPATIPDGTIDLIFTDPPYNKEWLHLYEQLGLLAFRVLKDGGSLVMYAGHYALPQIFEYMKTSGLKYWWEIVVKHNGGSKLLQYQHVYVMFKPLLWFVKGNKLKGSDSLKDLIESQPPDKALHEWQQSPVEAEHVISKLTIENDVVLDPLMGSGQ
jgi:16S rRNA G966 N2-methylase RsmD